MCKNKLAELFQGSIFELILLNFFINDLMFFISVTEFSNFDDDTTIYWCSLNYEEANHKLFNGAYIIINLFSISNMVANPEKIQITLPLSIIDQSHVTFVDVQIK